jgi:3-hydroxyisobutyrate dehydrogenase-like beta-hydroxyacid dehydrogenase
MRVGFVGLGSQGAPMARRIVSAGFGTTLWARRPETLEPFAGVAAAASPTALGAASDLVCVCVVDDAGVLDVTAGVLEGMAAGGVIAVHSTVHPDTVRGLARTAAAHGVTVVDAPVSGGAPAAEAGKLLVMAGGEAADVERCRPVFATYGDPVLHLGPLGAGQVTKLLNNLLFTANLGTSAALLDLGRSLGVEPAELSTAISHGTATSFALERVGDGSGLGRIAAHAGALLQKDVRLVASLAEAAAAEGGAALAAADTTLTRIGHPR